MSSPLDAFLSVETISRAWLRDLTIAQGPIWPWNAATIMSPRACRHGCRRGQAASGSFRQYHSPGSIAIVVGRRGVCGPRRLDSPTGDSILQPATGSSNRRLDPPTGDRILQPATGSSNRRLDPPTGDSILQPATRSSNTYLTLTDSPLPVSHPVSTLPPSTFVSTAPFIANSIPLTSQSKSTCAGRPLAQPARKLPGGDVVATFLWSWILSTTLNDVLVRPKWRRAERNTHPWARRLIDSEASGRGEQQHVQSVFNRYLAFPPAVPSPVSADNKAALQPRRASFSISRTRLISLLRSALKSSSSSSGAALPSTTTAAPALRSLHAPPYLSIL
ncbi:hypothetical protein E2P81_ATG12116 [Venturia nashicola]|nr:hypothetical protein E2P81_ATG12116 [Venturia nashicola]